jgi:glycosyltransferase involved in cell wall biosynthesis
VPADEVAAFYRRLDVFLFPSSYKHEAEPLVVLEAARAGVPTVAFDTGCIPALVPDPEWLVAADGPFAQTATKIISRFVEAPDHEDVRRAASHAVRAHFTARRERALDAQRELVRELTAQVRPT